ncbi:MAG: AI-2E family transporter [Abitibacteriaceae bacterium]|nr:AI-2E family transporter [Abditibacteriaceae bacterium]MBV9864701.1 AI-2E family transporter [Abditibacteriaceae bacterium]
MTPDLPSTSPPTSEPWTNRRILLLLAVGTLIVSALWNLPLEARYISERAGEVFVTLVFAMSLTYLLRPPVNALHGTRAFGSGSRQGRIGATVVVFLLCGLLLVCFLIIGLRPVTHNLSVLWNQWFVGHTPAERHEIIMKWQETVQNALAPYRSFLPASTGTVDVPDATTRVQGWVTQQVSQWFSHVGFIVELLLVPVLVFYFLTDGPAIRAEARLLCPPHWRPHISRMAAHFDSVFAGFIRGQLFMCLIAWVVVTLGLLLIGVKYAFTLGLIAGLARGIPVIGPMVGGVPIVLVCFITTRSLPLTGALMLGLTVMHLLESKVLLPKIVGHQVDLHPVSVIVSLLLGMEFFGFLGIFLAVPLAAVVKILLAEWHESQAAKLAAQQDATMGVADGATMNGIAKNQNALESALVTDRVHEATQSAKIVNGLAPVSSLQQNSYTGTAPKPGIASEVIPSAETPSPAAP